MSELMFRAWDKKTNKMYFVASIDMFGKVVTLLDDRGDTLDFIERAIHNVELMQATGLLDKNDVGIYEGDILAYETSQSTTKGVVEYGSGLYGWVHAGIWFHMWDMHLDSAEVIGNIYENPELLEQQ